MVVLKTAAELTAMRDAGRISAQALLVGGEAARPGVTTAEIDRKIHKFILSQGAKPSFLGYGGFPGSSCISVNDEVIHGIPGSRVIREGDIVSIDVGAYYKGYHGDNAFTFTVGSIAPDVQQLLDATQEGLRRGIAAAVPGNRIGDIGWAEQSSVGQLGPEPSRRSRSAQLWPSGSWHPPGARYGHRHRTHDQHGYSRSPGSQESVDCGDTGWQALGSL